ncbi:MAG: hypothetical protein COA58_03740 [Bacteroidetes bacterium]|nr:MAG: hypothetical protein COA58_03740 [Bacteroidota bacterium]
MTLLATNLEAKNRHIDFDNELKEAEVIKLCHVISYSDTTMTVIHIKSGDTLTFNCKGKVSADAYRRRTLEIDPSTNEMYGYWPKIGESVLILADSLHSIKLMALEMGSDYKFWDPNADLLGSWFHFSKLARPTVYCRDNSPSPMNQKDNCFDGCLYPIELINER